MLCFLGFLAAAAAIGAAAGFAAMTLIEDEREDAVEDLADRLAALFETAGQEAVVAEIRDGSADWAEDGVQARYAVSVDGPSLAGGEDLAGVRPGRSEHVAPGRDEDEPLMVEARVMADGSFIAVGASLEGYHDVAELMPEAALWGVALGLPLSLLISLILSAIVFRRIEAISDVAALVRQGDLDRRAPVSPRNDEFDALARRLNDMLAALQSLYRSVHDVSVGVAHDLKTPVTLLGAHLDELERNLNDGAETRRLLEGANAQVARILRTFDALLRIGEIETGARRKGFREVDLSALAGEVVESFEPVAADRGKRIALRLDGRAMVDGDEALLAQLLINLVENAIEHTGDASEIEVGVAKVGGVARLTVEDSGPGVPPDERERVFERFHRLDRSRHEPGDGLGLSLVRSITALHDGDVAIDESRLGGARVAVALHMSGKAIAVSERRGDGYLLVEPERGMSPLCVSGSNIYTRGK